MNLYSLALFAHVCGAIGMFASLGLLQVGFAALRRASKVAQVRALAWLIIFASPLTVLSAILLGVAGFYMAIFTWGLATPWIAVSIVSVLLIGPLGAFVLDPHIRKILLSSGEISDGPLPIALLERIHDPIAGTIVHVQTHTLFSLVFLMITKPPLIFSIIVVGLGIILGLLISLPLWRARYQHPLTNVEGDPFLRKTLWTRRW